jgi:hypothetical protein
MFEQTLVMNGYNLDEKSFKKFALNFWFHFIFKFKNLTSLVNFVVTFWLYEFPWNVFCCCVWWVYMWIKSHPIFIFFGVDNNDFLCAHGPWKLIKIYKFRPQGAIILGARVKKTIKGTTQISEYSLKPHFLIFERSQVKHNSLDCHHVFWNIFH